MLRAQLTQTAEDSGSMSIRISFGWFYDSARSFSSPQCEHLRVFWIADWREWEWDSNRRELPWQVEMRMPGGPPAMDCSRRYVVGNELCNWNVAGM